MAKKIKEEGEVKTPKPKKIKEPVIEKTTVEEQPTSLTEPVVEETKVEEEPVVKFNSETPHEADPELVVTEVIPEPEKVEMTIQPEVVEAIKNDTPPPIKVIANDERSMEEKIVAFLDSRDGTDIKLNDFLKSLFGVPKFNEPPNWLSQGASKQLRVLLGDMQTKGLISISNNMHTKLGTFYYEGNSPVTLYHSLNTVPLVAKK